MTLTVLCIATCNFLTFPVGLTVTVILDAKAMFSDDQQDIVFLRTYSLLSDIWFVLLSINCGINLVFYLVCSSK
jgi:hypothetical protein